jgi:hypothetical protein
MLKFCTVSAILYKTLDFFHLNVEGTFSDFPSGLPDGLHAKKLQFWEDLGTGNLECFI